MPDKEFIARVRRLKIHERTTRASNGIKSESTMVFASLKRLLEVLQEQPEDAELEVTRKKGKYILRIRK